LRQVEGLLRQEPVDVRIDRDRASGQINMRKIDGWQTLATKPIDQQIDLAA